MNNMDTLQAGHRLTRERRRPVDFYIDFTPITAAPLQQPYLSSLAEQPCQSRE
jgi:hypothetical protein